MFRKTMIALATVAALGALTPTAADARGGFGGGFRGGGFHGGGFGGGFRGAIDTVAPRRLPEQVSPRSRNWPHDPSNCDRCSHVCNQRSGRGEQRITANNSSNPDPSLA